MRVHIELGHPTELTQAPSMSDGRPASPGVWSTTGEPKSADRGGYRRYRRLGALLAIILLLG
jgi:hypothetical protein